MTVAVLIALTAYRIWRLVALDAVTDSLRLRFVPPASKRELFLECPWCLGTWLAAVVWGVTWAFVPLVAPGLVLGAATALVGLFGTVDKWHHSRPQ